MRKQRNIHQVEDLRNDQSGAGNFHRRLNVFLSVETRRQNLNSDQTDQTDGITCHSSRSLINVIHIKTAALEQHGDEPFPEKR